MLRVVREKCNTTEREIGGLEFRALERKELDLDMSEEKLVLAQESIGMCKK